MTKSTTAFGGMGPLRLATPLLMLALTGCVALIPSAWTVEGYTLNVSHLSKARSIVGSCFQLTSDAHVGAGAKHVEINLGQPIDVDGWLSPRDLSAPGQILPAGSAVIVEDVIQHGNVEDAHERIYARVHGLLLDTSVYFYVEDSRYKADARFLVPCTAPAANS